MILPLTYHCTSLGTTSYQEQNEREWTCYVPSSHNIYTSLSLLLPKQVPMVIQIVKSVLRPLCKQFLQTGAVIPHAFVYPELRRNMNIQCAAPADDPRNQPL